ncbi:MAG: hypothetical protein RBS72_18095 [Sedimentisphaerales bacterium]|jgi:hypothetical protein|nr:hypothetical protein [Sedimentisphaerales bacterium]HNY78459.1 hypothetical protein [Sedimentisphaerales bacterium]HOC63660.1 hypothetical protein [Sedimentisphaerales bacterium]HOH64401.1 hypothetical protein [Sedimentisphaerales bacterium]HPY49300.1 hypothetical protein [Sedimentisphaerales bacterium]
MAKRVTSGRKRADSPGKTRRLPVGGQLFVTLDEEDFQRLRGYTWTVQQNPTGKLYVRRATRLSERTGPSTVSLAREIAGARPGERVERRNKNPLDFRRLNLAIRGRE